MSDSSSHSGLIRSHSILVFAHSHAMKGQEFKDLRLVEQSTQSELKLYNWHYNTAQEIMMDNLCTH